MAETLIYLDHAATTPLRPEVLEAMLPFLREHHGNPSSLHRAGTRARRAVNVAREQVAALIGASPSEIVFTSGGTEADNLAIAGILQLAPGQAAIGATEHHAVLEPAHHWCPTKQPLTLPVDRHGRLDLGHLDQALKQGAALVSIMHGNNETGLLHPIEAIGTRCRERGVPYHADAVQSAGHVPLDVHRLPVDLLSISGHKLGGPKGAGALYVREGLPLARLLSGGGQESKRRAGTENVAGIVGFGVACERAHAELAAEPRRITALRQRLEVGIRMRIADCWINSGGAERLPHIASVGIAGVEGEGILYGLDAEGICVSTGSACTAGKVEPSHVLQAMGQSAGEALATVRFSLGRTNTEADIDRVLNVLPRVVQELRG